MNSFDVSQIDPANPSVVAALAPCVDAAAFELYPGGGEAYGWLAVSSVPWRRGRELEAFVQAWKALLCLGEEWDYEVWNEETSASVAREFFVHEISSWDFSPDGARLLEGLLDRWRAIFDAPRSSVEAYFLPSQRHWAMVEMLDRNFLRNATYLFGLANQWNYLAAVFVTGSRLVIVDWSTSG